MEGVAERDRRAVGRDVALAWRTEMFARVKRLENLGHYLDQMKPKTRRSGSALDVFREYQALGAPITIRHFGPDGKELN